MAEILIIDDDDVTCCSLRHIVTRMGHEATCASSLQEGVDLATGLSFDVVLLNGDLPDGNSLDKLPTIRGVLSSPEVIIITACGEPGAAETAIMNGAWDYIEKGAALDGIKLPLMRAIQYRQEKIACCGKNVTALKRDDIIGNGPRITACLDIVAQAAVNDTTVLITGETGTGKELFARAIHNNSMRPAGNFVVVDCAVLPETLVESLLFGHKKGSFTGAVLEREGLIRQAHGGTLFLDEVGELSFPVQKAFLRVLQEHRFRPLGGSREIESNFRLVSATNRDLDAMVHDGEFRSDLLFRIRGLTIELPRLRERIEDLKELVRYHTDRLCERYGLALKGFAPEFQQTLAEYHWPGNVRELINTLERTIATARFEPTLFPKHLPTDIRVQVARAATDHGHQTACQRSSPEGLPPLHDFRDEVYGQSENQYLHQLIALVKGNISEACRISGLSQSRLYALMKTHNIHRQYLPSD
jgi:two-component system, NtrC family, response regulator